MTGVSAPPGEFIGTALRTQGYLHLAGAFSQDLMAAVRDELDQAITAEEQRFGLGALISIGQNGYVCDVPGMGQATRAMLDDELISHLVYSALDVGARLSIAQGIRLDPGQGRGQWPRRWHADLYQIRQCVPDPGFCFGINCLVVLDDMTEHNGATCVIPGSHAFVNPRSAEGAELEPLAVSIAADAGTVLVLDAGLWHAAGHNQSDRPRRIMKLLFVRRWIRPQLDYPRAVCDQVAAALGDRAAALLGLEGRPPAAKGR